MIQIDEKIRNLRVLLKREESALFVEGSYVLSCHRSIDRKLL